jgi:hypothetical protein
MRLIDSLTELLVEQLIPAKDDVFLGVSDALIRSALESIVRFKRIVIVDDEGNPIKAESGDVLYDAIKNGKITVQEFGKVTASILKNTGMDKTLMDAVAKELINTTTFKRKYGNSDNLTSDLKNAGYTDDAIKIIIKNFRPDEVEVEIPQDVPKTGNKIESIVDSIKNRRITVIYYDGDEPGGKGNREIEPVCFGYSKAGNQVVRAWDFLGASHTDYLGTQPLPGWRLFRVDKIQTYIPTAEKFDEIRPNYNKTGDKSMSRVIINAKF